MDLEEKSYKHKQLET